MHFKFPMNAYRKMIDKSHSISESVDFPFHLNIPFIKCFYPRVTSFRCVSVYLDSQLRFTPMCFYSRLTLCAKNCITRGIFIPRTVFQCYTRCFHFRRLKFSIEIHTDITTVQSLINKSPLITKIDFFLSVERSCSSRIAVCFDSQATSARNISIYF